MNSLPHFDKIFVEKGSEHYRVTRTLLQNYPSISPQTVLSSREVFIDLPKTSADPIGDGKKQLFIGKQNGSFLKKCPGTKNMVCCNYYVLNIATHCSLNCSYCILQEYFQNNPLLKVFANIEDCFLEIDSLIRSGPKGIFRIGMGEYTDSLALDEVTGFSNDLISYFQGKKNLILELKTKTVNISNLLKYENVGNIVVAWSVNPNTIIECEEEGAAKLEERLDAASACMEKGYKIAFHFDPIILYKGWEKEYRETVENIFKQVNPETILWISLGGFRYRPALKNIIRERFPGNRLLAGEFVLCEDGKMRYLKHLRVEAYSKITKWIKNHGPSLKVYLCMESPEVWRQVFNKTPQCEEKLDLLFDDD